ncbi:MAG: DUF362 domain-containing protein [Candidatus Diapherotrites archaeon]|nr:DUF362 domain-containing protein [Candidatus Diapherotrites archaeon]
MAARLAALVKGPERKQNIKSALGYIMPDLEKALEGKRNILLKPNLVGLQPTIANTHVDAVSAAIEFLQENFADSGKMRITVAEGSGDAHYAGLSTLDVFKNCGFYALQEKFKNIKLEAVDEWQEWRELPIRTISGSGNIRVPSDLGRFDFIISLAIPKTHDAAIATLALKNMMGLVHQNDKAFVHGIKTPYPELQRRRFVEYIPMPVLMLIKRLAPNASKNYMIKSGIYGRSVKAIHHNIAEFSKALWPGLAILDAFECMEGNGPTDGSAVRMSCAIASCDALKADALGARLMGLEPEEIGYLHYLRGRGDISLGGLVGNAKLQECARAFKMHSTYEIQSGWREN